MNKKGFILIEVLVGLFLLGLISVTCLPILSNASHHLILVKDRMDMLFTAESVIEQIKSFDYNCIQKNEYLYDIQLIELIEKLEENDLVTFQLPLDIENSNHKNTCIISKKKHSENLWEIEVEVSLLEKEKKVPHIKIIACMEIPQKKDMEKK